MRWLQSIIANRNVKSVLLVGGIFFLSLLTFNILFDASTPDNYPRELLAALVGTLMAAVVTTVLLTQQSKGEELKERNVEVFRKKIAAYEIFIDRAILHASDGVLDKDEAVELRKAIYGISLVSSSDTVTKLVSYVRTNFLKDDSSDIGDVVAAFRRELNLDELGLNTMHDMTAIDAMISGTTDTDQMNFIKNRLTAARDVVLDLLQANSPEIFGGIERDDAFGLGDGATVLIECKSKISYQMDLAYLAGPTDPISGIVNLSDIPKPLFGKLQKLLSSIGFQEDATDPEAPEFLVDEGADIREHKDDEGRLVWTIQNLADAIIAVERGALTNGGNESRPTKAPVAISKSSKGLTVTEGQNVIDATSFASLVPQSLLDRPGSVFYSGRAAFSAPSSLYILGLNPGGVPSGDPMDTIARNLANWKENLPEKWSAYSDDIWGGLPGTHGMQPGVLHLLNNLGLDPRQVPASNVVFVRTRDEASLAAEKQSLLKECWTVHSAVIEQLGVSTILCFGGTAGWWV